jgi:hypothetical protein
MNSRGIFLVRNGGFRTILFGSAYAKPSRINECSLLAAVLFGNLIVGTALERNFTEAESFPTKSVQHRDRKP